MSEKMDYEFEKPCWYEPDSGEDHERATHLLDHARDIESRHQEQHENNLLYAQMYSNRDLPTAGFDWGYGIQTEVSLSPISRLSENLALSITDTFVSQIGKMRPKATVVLRGAPWKLRKQGKMADRWLYASFLHLKVYTKGKIIFRDAAVFGFGAARVDVDAADKLCVERLFPDDVLVDQRECLSGSPPVHVMIRRAMTYDEAKARFNLDPETLEKAGGKRYLEYRGHGKDHVIVVEAWRRALPGPGKRPVPGRHMVAIEGCVITDEPYKYTWLPIVFFNWAPPLNGWYNPGVVEQIFNYQLRLNEVNERIRECQHIMAVPRILVPKGSDINVHQITNEIGKFIRYTGPLEPKALQWTAASAEIYNERDRLVRSCYEFMGISQLSAQSKAPESTRFDSAPAFREFNQIEQARFTDLAQRFEEFYLDLAHTIMRVMHCRGKVTELMTFRDKGTARSQVIDWRELDLDEAQYYLSLEASSSMNQTPAARLDVLEQMRARGEITAEEYQQHMTNPDLEQLASLSAAASEEIDRVIEVLEDGEYESPDEMQDLMNGLPRVHHAYLGLRKWEGVPMEVHENFEAWMLHAKSIVAPEPEEEGVPLASAGASAMPMMGMDPMMMGGAGMPPPGMAPPPMGGGAPPMGGLPS